MKRDESRQAVRERFKHKVIDCLEILEDEMELTPPDVEECIRKAHIELERAFTKLNQKVA